MCRLLVSQSVCGAAAVLSNLCDEWSHVLQVRRWGSGWNRSLRSSRERSRFRWACPVIASPSRTLLLQSSGTSVNQETLSSSTWWRCTPLRSAASSPCLSPTSTGDTHHTEGHAPVWAISHTCLTCFTSVWPVWCPAGRCSPRSWSAASGPKRTKRFTPPTCWGWYDTPPTSPFGSKSKTSLWHHSGGWVGQSNCAKLN